MTLSPSIKFLAALAALVWLTQTGAAPADPALVHHDIQARLDPRAGTIAASDRLTLPPGTSEWTFYLHAGLAPKVSAGAATLEPLGTEAHLEHYRLRPAGPDPITLTYGGSIRHDLEAVPESLGRTHQQSLGSIGAEGVFLSGATGWYPTPQTGLQRFALDVTVPEGWMAVSQGAGPDTPADPAQPNPAQPNPNSVRATGEVRQTWREDQPQDEVYLIAAPFTLYRQAGPGAEAQVYLRSPDRALAERYLEATGRYIDLYSKLIGPYPYAKFALVENFWESGYGMPSFTLLGPQVIRLPFIVETSFPHEILHNWWGNGVYVDYASGNWSEGLTAYLADYLLAERRDGGTDYRRNALKSYADYVRRDQDFPLTEFRSRHSSASQAVGYGKAMMFFHMLRRQLGDQAFAQGIRRFYADNRFRTAGYAELEQAFERASSRDLGPFFRAWTTRAGAPRLKLADVTLHDDGQGFRLSGRVDQTQVEAPWPLDIRLVIDLAGGRVREETLTMDGRSARFDLDLPVLPLRVAVDPEFDSFRMLAEGEAPVTLGRLFGAERGTLIWPASAPPPLAAAYRTLAKTWAADHPGWELRSDRDLVRLPQHQPVWLLGWENAYLSAFAAGDGQFRLDPGPRTLEIPGQESLPPGPLTSVLTGTRDGQPIGWLAVPDPAALPGLARKLPHYGKYSWLVFTGDAPDIQAKGLWPAGDSELSAWLTPERPQIKYRPRPSLADQAQ